MKQQVNDSNLKGRMKNTNKKGIRAPTVGERDFTSNYYEECERAGKKT